LLNYTFSETDRRQATRIFFIHGFSAVYFFNQKLSQSSIKRNDNMNYFFTSESVSEGHPDKVADQISDALLDQFLARDPNSKVAIETLCTTGQVVIAGEVKSKAYIDVQDVTRKLINHIGYNRGAYRFDGDSCGILTAVHEQSPDINQGVDREDTSLQGAGDQGMMFGYAVNETENYMPLSLELAHLLVKELAEIRREAKQMTYYRKGKLVSYLRPDSKSQVTIEYDGDTGKPLRVDTIVISTQHDDFTPALGNTPEAGKTAEEETLRVIRRDVEKVLLPRVLAKLPEHLKALFDDRLKLYVNPTGRFVIGGPHGDTGLTGRKIIVDTYGGHGAHGGGAFSGKDPSKVDRSAAYAARHIAKNLVSAGVAERVLVQVAYAIGRAEPVSLFINTYNTNHTKYTDAEIATKVREIFDMRPAAIVKRLKLLQPMYLETAAYGHMGRKPIVVRKTFGSRYEKTFEKEVELFTWEKLDYLDTLRKALL